MFISKRDFFKVTEKEKLQIEIRGDRNTNYNVHLRIIIKREHSNKYAWQYQNKIIFNMHIYKNTVKIIIGTSTKILLPNSFS